MTNRRIEQMTSDEIDALTDEEIDELVDELIDGDHVTHMPANVANDDGVVGDDIPDKATE